MNMINRAKRYWKKRFNWTTQQINSIDWGIFKRAQRMSSQSQRIWRSKHMQHNTATAVNMERRGATSSNLCPNCERVEDNIHVVRCGCTSAQELFDRDIADIQEWMTKSSSTVMYNTIAMLLKAARSGQDLDFNSIEDQDMRAAAIHQWSLGSHYILWGLWVKDWVRLQAKELAGTCKCPKVWFGKLSNHIWKISEDLLYVWKLRNESIHKNDKSRYNQERNKQVDAEIDRIYDKLPTNMRRAGTVLMYTYQEK
jgi:hypothetical protein